METLKELATEIRKYHLCLGCQEFSGMRYLLCDGCSNFVWQKNSFLTCEVMDSTRLELRMIGFECTDEIHRVCVMLTFDYLLEINS